MLLPLGVSRLRGSKGLEQTAVCEGNQSVLQEGLSHDLQSTAGKGWGAETEPGVLWVKGFETQGVGE